MENGHITNTSLYECDRMAQVDCERICSMLEKIVGEGRIAADGEQFKKLNN